MDERERSIIAAHEVGHAICGKVHGDKRKVEEISLFAHGEALGVTVSSQEDNDLPSESDLRARLVALMGGRAAEELLFHEVTGGASNDFETANKIATRDGHPWGMGRDPEAADGGMSGRGIALVPRPEPATGRCRPRSRPPRRGRSGRSSTTPTPRPAGRSSRTWRRCADSPPISSSTSGSTARRSTSCSRAGVPSPNADDEWRAATSRPRAWGDVVDLAAHRAGATAALAPVAVIAPAPALAAPEAVPAASIVAAAADTPTDPVADSAASIAAVAAPAPSRGRPGVAGSAMPPRASSVARRSGWAGARAGARRALGRRQTPETRVARARGRALAGAYLPVRAAHSPRRPSGTLLPCR